MKLVEDLAVRVIDWFSGKPSLYEVRLNPTNNCNLACLPCVSRGRPPFRPEEELSKDIYLKIIKEAADLGVKRFDICGGGEPFMRAEVTLAIMKEIKNLGIRGSMSTNGTLFTKDMIKQIVEMGWDEIRFSINGPNNKIDDRIRGFKGTFRKSIETIKTFNYFKRELNKNKPLINLMPILTSLNYNKMCEFVELVRSLEVDAFTFQPFMSETPEDPRKVSERKRRRISRKLEIKKRQRKKLQFYLEMAEKLAEKYELTNNFDFMGINEIEKTTDKLISSDVEKADGDPLLAIPCYAPWWLIDIDPNGGVGLCSCTRIRENIRVKSLKEMWFSKKFEDFRKMLANSQIPKECKTCCAISVRDNRKIRNNISKILMKNCE